MSTISLPHEKQIRHFFVADAIAAETTAATFRASASIGEVQIFDANGNAFTYATAPADGGDFYIAKINQKGSVSKSDFITPGDITYLKGTAPRTKVGKSQSFTLAGAPTVGAEYRLVGKVNYGNSEENFITFWAGALAVTGDTAQSILARLAEAMADDLAFSVNTKSQSPSTETVAGDAAEGSVQLTGGASGSVDSITVGGVELLASAVAFNTSLNQTASDVADAINANVTVPNFNASAATDTVTITAVDPGVDTSAVVSSATTITTTDVNMGGVTAGTSTNTADSNKYFKIGAAGGVLTITEKDWILEDFRVGLRSHDQLLWNFEMQTSPDTELTSNVTKTSTTPVFPTGEGYQMIELERFTVGHRAEFETKDHTLEFGRDYDVDLNTNYYMLDLKYFDVSRDDPKRSDKMLTIISSDPLVIDAIGFAIEAQMGFAEGDRWTELDPNADGADNV